jgi:hypothetical protein
MTKREIIRHLESYGFKLSDAGHGFVGLSRAFPDGSCLVLTIPPDDGVPLNEEHVGMGYYDGQWGPQFTTSLSIHSFVPAGAHVKVPSDVSVIPS